MPCTSLLAVDVPHDKTSVFFFFFFRSRLQYIYVNIPKLGSQWVKPGWITYHPQMSPKVCNRQPSSKHPPDLAEERQRTNAPSDLQLQATHHGEDHTFVDEASWARSVLGQQIGCDKIHFAAKVQGVDAILWSYMMFMISDASVNLILRSMSLVCCWLPHCKVTEFFPLGIKHHAWPTLCTCPASHRAWADDSPLGKRLGHGGSDSKAVRLSVKDHLRHIYNGLCPSV